MFPGLIHVCSSIGTSFLFCLKKIPLYVYTYFIYPFICDGHVNCFHFLAIVNNAAVCVCVQVLFEQFLGIYLGVELPGPTTVL